MCTVLPNPQVAWYNARKPYYIKYNLNPMSKTKNIYPDEQKKLDLQEENEMELMLKVMDLLDDYGYELTSVLEDGVPVLKLSQSL